MLLFEKLWQFFLQGPDTFAKCQITINSTIPLLTFHLSDSLSLHPLIRNFIMYLCRTDFLWYDHYLLCELDLGQNGHCLLQTLPAVLPCLLVSRFWVRLVAILIINHFFKAIFLILLLNNFKSFSVSGWLFYIKGSLFCFIGTVASFDNFSI